MESRGLYRCGRERPPDPRQDKQSAMVPNGGPLPTIDWNRDSDQVASAPEPDHEPATPGRDGDRDVERQVLDPVLAREVGSVIGIVVADWAVIPLVGLPVAIFEPVGRVDTEGGWLVDEAGR